MTNTALRAENSNSRTITFKSREHEKFYDGISEKMQISGCLPSGFGLLPGYRQRHKRIM